MIKLHRDPMGTALSAVHSGRRMELKDGVRRRRNAPAPRRHVVISLDDILCFLSRTAFFSLLLPDPYGDETMLRCGTYEGGLVVDEKATHGPDDMMHASELRGSSYSSKFITAG